MAEMRCADMYLFSSAMPPQIGKSLKQCVYFLLLLLWKKKTLPHLLLTLINSDLCHTAAHTYVFLSLTLLSS